MRGRYARKPAIISCESTSKISPTPNQHAHSSDHLLYQMYASRKETFCCPRRGGYVYQALVNKFSSMDQVDVLPKNVKRHMSDLTWTTLHQILT